MKIPKPRARMSDIKSLLIISKKGIKASKLKKPLRKRPSYDDAAPYG
jgi:hypothetical protein